MIRYPVDSPLVLDLDLLVSRSNDNPVFYVQYCHARVASLFRNAGFAASSRDLVVSGSGATQAASPYPLRLGHLAVGTIPTGKPSSTARLVRSQVLPDS